MESELANKGVSIEESTILGIRNEHNAITQKRHAEVKRQKKKADETITENYDFVVGADGNFSKVIFHSFYTSF